MAEKAKEQALAKLSDLARLADVLEMEIERWTAEVKDEPADWGHVGTLAEARVKLVEVIAAVSGMETSDIEEFLADAECDTPDAFDHARDAANRNRDRR